MHVAPILLGSGAALFADVVGGGEPLARELVRTVASPHVTHLSYRVAR